MRIKTNASTLLLISMFRVVTKCSTAVQTSLKRETKMKKQNIFCRAIVVVWVLRFCALPVTPGMAGHFACAFQRQLSAGENIAGTGCKGVL